MNDAENWCVKYVLDLNCWKKIMCIEKAILPFGELAVDEDDNNGNNNKAAWNDGHECYRR